MLDVASTTNTHGGRRAGAGRKRSKFRHDAPHRSRPVFTRPSAVHVSMRGRWMTGLRCDRVYRLLGDVIERYRDREDFRVVHVSIQDNHLHLIVEAANSEALERGMRSFTINAARAIHRASSTAGPLFYRYHSTVITTRRYARNVIAYVLGNWRRHKEDIVRGRILDAMLDRYSSAISFDGWNVRFAIPAGYTPLPVSPPSTHLLTRGWAYNGPLDPYQVPGPMQ